MLAQQKSLTYKGLNLTEHLNGSVLEIIVCENCFNNTASCIESISYLVEFVAIHGGIRYVIFNKLNTDFELNSILYGFFQNHIFPQLHSYGVLMTHYLVNKNQYDSLYKNVNERNSFMMAFLSLEESLRWINEQS